jgi:hypothetical protein
VVGTRATRRAAIALGLLALAVIGSPAAEAREQTTWLISRAKDGGLPNGPSTNAVISNDRRYARVIAFQSEATDLVSGDDNRHQDVFAIKRGGSFGNDGAPWDRGSTLLISRGRGGDGANGKSWGASVDGSFTTKASCVAFLSDASNLVSGDTNGRTDAFVSRGPGRAPARVSLPGGSQSDADTTDVAVSGNCKRIAFVTGGKLYVRRGKKVKKLGKGSDPSWSTGKAAESDLVYTGSGGVRLSRGGRKRGKLVGPGGSDPAYNNVKRKVLAYEQERGGTTQIVVKDLDTGDKVATKAGGDVGNGSSRDPVIGNSGFYVSFESDASNLVTDASGRRNDDNGASDVYLFTDVRNLTLRESVAADGSGVAGGGSNPSMSFYANYIVFDSPAPLGGNGPRQIFMRWLGAV